MASQEDRDYATADRLLWTAVGSQRRWVILAAVAGLTAATATLLLPTAVGQAMDAALAGGDDLARALALLGLTLVALLVSGVTSQLATTAGTEKTTAWLRHRMLATILDRGLGVLRAYQSGDALARINTGASYAGRSLPLLLSVAETTVVTIASLVLLGLIDWLLPLTLLLGLPIALVLVLPFTRRATAVSTDYQQVQGEIASRLVDALRGIRTIRASGTAEREVDRVLDPLPRLRAAGMRSWGLQQGIAWAFALLVPGLQVTIVAVAGLGVSQDRVSLGDLVAAVGYAGLALGVLERVDVFLELTQVRAGAGRLADLATHAPGRPRDGQLPLGDGEVEFRNVTVESEDGRVLLDRISVRIPAGATVAIVGASGAGKSLLVGMLGGLSEPTSGLVSIDGFPTQLLAPEQRRAAVAYAFEQPNLFGQTVADAVRYAAPAAEPTEDDRVVAAARAARADGFIRRLPEGYQTPVEALRLSGGERQRLGLARAVAQQARVLVLDDATSSLDTATEAEVEAALMTALPDHTRLVVAHRAVVAAAADWVVWLDGGRLRAVDTHARLWGDPRYRNLFAVADHTATMSAASHAQAGGVWEAGRLNGHAPTDHLGDHLGNGERR